jgi:hypothetical protein
MLSSSGPDPESRESDYPPLNDRTPDDRPRTTGPPDDRPPDDRPPDCRTPVIQ